MRNQSGGEMALRVALASAALLVAYTGVDNAFGGIATLGLQGPVDFFQVVDERAFAVRDSHVRFLGGVWLGIALVFAGGAVWLNAFRPAILTIGALALVGGLARFSAMGVGDVIDRGLAAPVIAELLVLPLLGVSAWLMGARAPAAAKATEPLMAAPGGDGGVFRN